MTPLEIYNAALSLVGGKGRLSSLTQNSNLREECDIWFSLRAKQAQEAGYWPCCHQVTRLARFSTRDGNVDWTETAPPPEYTYAYTLPDPMLRPWYLADFRVFSLTYDPTVSRMILSCDDPAPVLHYSAYRDNPATWPHNLQQSVIHALAGSIAVALAGSPDKALLNMQLADRFLEEARVIGANMDRQPVEYIPEALRGREEVWEGFSPSRYFYPLAATFSGSFPNA